MAESPIKLSVRLFGGLREEAGSGQLEIELAPASTVAHLRAHLAARLPSVARLGERLAVSVNLEVAASGHLLQSGDEVALLPPVAGGSGATLRRCTIHDTVLDPDEVVARVSGDDTGGIVSFVGTVRDHSHGHSIKFLEYEAYPEMAEREMEKIADRAAQRWPGTRIAIAHRVGHLEIGDAAVVIVAAAAHRAEAFEACRFAIDTLKQTVPIWKKEVATDGEYWVDDHA
ncbi:MAG: molybdenum cofactor biosynthesis protein MoaE [Deltaproteobacteria bacterium]|nr:molybdenum cofactor biosynthesis protein MoaE [Deltaproteobacteria bacterium]MBW2382036.1 molybdenum cofactor biosynthesis protein MoaE [Deltaproteobacteria bacterium]MBW2696913.1 molybdenum cofactor biosynthesis protein MoaE [Deltaproteobacteria bacterium]